MEKFDFIVNIEDKSKRLDAFLLEKLSIEITRSCIKNLIDNGFVLVNDKKVKAGYSLKLNDKVFVELKPKESFEDILPENIKLDIVYEDDFLAVINKPQGMTVHPAKTVNSGTLVNALLYHFKNNLSQINGDFRPGIVHRLDKDTSGLIVVAKNDKTHLALQKQIQDKTCHRIYQAVVYGKFNTESGTIITDLARGKREYEKIFVVPAGQGREAITNYKVLNYNSGYSLVEFELKTGRTHQIRVHTSYKNHPIVGDKVYGKKDEKHNLSGQLLHAINLEFIHPETNKQMSFYAPIPDYFKEFLLRYKLD